MEKISPNDRIRMIAGALNRAEAELANANELANDDLRSEVDRRDVEKLELAYDRAFKSVNKLHVLLNGAIKRARKENPTGIVANSGGGK